MRKFGFFYGLTQSAINCRRKTAKVSSTELKLAIMSAATRENRSSGFPTRSDENRPVQSQKNARSLKFRIKEEEGLYIICVMKTKVLISCAVTAHLICAFVYV